MATELDRLYFTIDADTRPYEAKLKSLGNAAKGTGHELNRHLTNAGEGAEKLHRGIEVSRRELLYFGREVATGDFARLPSTMVLIGSHMAGLTSQAIIMGGAVIAPFALMATAAYQAEKAQERVRMAIASTGNAAGITASQVSDMAAKLGADPKSGLSERGALDSMGILAKSTNVGGGNLSSGAMASAGFARMTGMSQDKASEALGKMMESPAKAAAELDKQFNLLSDAELRHILSLSSRDQQEAELFQKLKQRGDETADSMWSLSKGMEWFTQKLASGWFHTGQMLAGAEKKPLPLDTQLYQQQTVARNLQQEYGANDPRVKEAWKRAGDIHWQMGADQRRKDKEAAEDARSPGAMELGQYQDTARIYRSTGPRDRAMALARAAANRKFTTDQYSTEAGVAPRAGAIRDAAIAAAQAEQNSARRQALTLAQQGATAEENLAKAYHETVAAGEEQNIVNKAHAEFLKGAIDDEAAYADALRRTAAAQRQVSAEKKDSSLATDVQALRLENSMQGQTNEAKERAVALLRMHNELQDEGWDLTTKAGQDELAQRKAIINAQQDQLQLQKDINDEQRAQLSIADDAASTLDQMMADPKNALKSLAGGVSKELRDLSINQLRNHMTGAITGEPGTLPTFSTLGNMLAGPGKRGESEGMPMYVKIVDGGGGSGGGQGGVMAMLTNFVDGRIGNATAAIQQGAVDVFSNAIARGFTPGAISA